MMVEPDPKREYSGILLRYLSDQKESDLLAAQDLGRNLVAQDVPIEEIATLHEDALEAMKATVSAEEIPEHSLLASAVLLEVLMAYGLVYREKIAQLNKRERELFESQVQLRAIFNNTPVCLGLKDTDGRYQLVNKPYEEWLGLPAEEIIGKKASELLDDAIEVETFTAAERTVLDTGEVSEREINVSKPDGNISDLVVITYPVKSADGSIMAIGTVAIDITERKRAALADSLAAANKKLEVANQELQAFSYSVSHDLRAPLRAMDGFSQALVDDYGDKLDDTARDYLGRVRAASQRMAQLIDDILVLSRISRREMARKDVDLSAMAEEIGSRLQDAEPDRDVDILVEPGLVAEADEGLVRVVLENLLGNAWKFTNHRDSPARIQFGAEEADGARAFFVRDNGAGFDMAYADKLFQPFQRLHADAEYEGTGIGLATVARAVHRHGGRVFADSEIGKGTTMHFTLEEE